MIARIIGSEFELDLKAIAAEQQAREAAAKAVRDQEAAIIAARKAAREKEKADLRAEMEEHRKRSNRQSGSNTVAGRVQRMRRASVEMLVAQDKGPRVVVGAQEATRGQVYVAYGGTGRG